jgi:hypothetical protein
MDEMELPPFRRRRNFVYVRANRWIAPPRIINLGLPGRVFNDPGQESLRQASGTYIDTPKDIRITVPEEG